MPLTKAGNPRKRPARQDEGRPTKYKPEYCQMLIEHGKKGLSFDSFAGAIGISRETLFDWARDITEFSDAKRQCTEFSRSFWDSKALEALSEKNEYDERGRVINSTRINPTVLIFNLKNRFRDQWRDQVVQTVDQTTTVKDDKEVTNLRRQLKSLADELKSRKSKK